MSVVREGQAGNPFLATVPGSQHLQVRDGIRTQIMQAGGVDIDSRAAIARNDDPRQLTDQFEHDSLQTIEQAGLREAALPVQPWAGHYSTTLMAAGLLGCRYQDFSQAMQGLWKEQFEYIRNHPAEVIVGPGLAGKPITLLLPSNLPNLLVFK